MERTPTLFLRDNQTHELTIATTPGCEWVLAGEGVATEKIDGLTMRLHVCAGRLVSVERRRAGQFVALTPTDPQDIDLLAAARNTRVDWWEDGDYTCEAIGPTIAGDRYREARPTSRRLDPQMLPIYQDAPRDFAGLWRFLLDLRSLHQPRAESEGIVFWHPNGRRAKIKVRDFHRQ